MSKKNSKPIILCCGENGRAVVYGHVTSDPTPGEPVTMTDARMVIYWSAECRGLFGLAANGPQSSTRLTPSVAKVTETIWQEFLTVSPSAAKALDKWPV